MKNLSLWTLVLSFCLSISTAFAQPWTYDFGTATGTANNSNSGSGNTGFFTGTPSGGGTYRVRIGSAGGNLTLGDATSLGSGSEAALTAATSTSSNKFTIYNWNTPSTTSYVKFGLRSTSAGNGNIDIHLGNGIGLFTDNTNSAYNNSLAVVRLVYTGGTLAVSRRISGSFSAIASSGIAKDTDNTIEIYGNNGSSGTTYTKSGSNSLNAQSWDLWVDGVKISPSGGWPRAGTLASNVNLAGIGFFAESSASNAAVIYLDDFEYSNSLPVALCTAPATQASNIIFPNTTATNIDVNWTNGDGDGRVVVMNSTNSFTDPTTGSNVTADLSWNNAGQQVIYNGTGSGPVTVTDLSTSSTYYFRVYEYCSPDRVYQTATATDNPLSESTIAGTGLSANALAAFGNECVGGTYGPNSFTITGTLLTTDNVTVGPLSGYQFSTTEFGTYSNDLDLTQPGGSYSQQIWVKFLPVSGISYDGSIPVGGGGASTINVAASGSGNLGLPTVTSPTSGSITASSAILGGNVTSIGCSNVVTRGIFWSTTNGFADGAGTEVSEAGTFGVEAFTLNVSGLPAASTVYFKAFAVNGSDTTFTGQQSFNTLQVFLNVADISVVGWNANSPDDFAFVSWVELPANIIIKFTDNGFNGTAPNSQNTTGNARGTEGFVIWKNTTGNPIAAGTVIIINGLSANLGTASAGTASVGMNGGLASGGDQIFAYQGNALTGANADFAGTGTSTTFSGNLLFGLHFQGSGGQSSWRTGGSTTSNDSYLPTELNVANANIAFGSSVSYGQYTGTRSGQATLAAYKTLVTNPANWTTGTGASGTVSLDNTAFTISTSTATQVVVTDLNNSVVPTQGQPFSITIESQDDDNLATFVSTDTEFLVSVFSGTGVLTGTTTGTMLAGNSQITISGLVYDTAESGIVLQVTATSGDVLSPGNTASFTMAPQASQLEIVGLQTFAYTANNLVAFTVEARRVDDSVDPTYTANIEIQLFSGTGALLGTLIKPAVEGVALFTGISIDTPGVKTIRAISGSLTEAVSAPITVSTPNVTDVIVPQYMQGRSGTNANRIPVAFRVRINGLEANKTFRYYSVMDTVNNSTTGAGIILIANQSGSFTRATTGSYTTAGAYGEFTTDANGAYTGWFLSEPSGNDRFSAGNELYGRIFINDPSQGTGTVARVSTNSKIKVLDLGTGASAGTGLRGNSSATARNFITLYDNTFGSGRPVSCTFVESDGTANTAGNNYANFYSTAVEGVAGAYGTIIPNTLPNGIRRIEQRSLETGFFVSCPAIDSDGVWPSGVNTVNPNSGTTARVIAATDAPFDPECVFLTFGNNDNFLNASISSTSGGSYPNSNCFSNTLVGAGVSPEGSTLNVLPTGGQDRWYAVVAPSSVLRVISNSSAFDVVLELHAANGALIDTENSVAGIGGETMTTTGLTVGQYYFVAVRSYDGTLGNYSVCLQAILASQPANGSNTLELCSNFKPQWTGANSYTITFTGTGSTPVGPTSITVPGQVALSNPALALQYGGTYDVRVDANYTSLAEPVTVLGTPVAITIAQHALLDVKATQKCPAVLLRGTILNAKPFVCGATNFTVSFQRISACTGGTYVDPSPFEVTTNAASSNLQLNFTLPQQLVAQSWYEVKWRPNFSYGTGTYGPASVIFIGGSVLENAQSLNELVAETQRVEGISAEAAIYPNPNKGDQFSINLTDITSNEVFVRVMDTMGRVVYSNRYSVDGSLNTVVSFGKPLTAGMYMVEFSVNGEVITERMIVNP